MTQIKKITDKQGNDIYLRTHTKAVVDDNGYTVESRLQAMQDEINQTQLEVGAVSSDLTPTEDSTNWVTSGGVYNALPKEDTILFENSSAANWQTGNVKSDGSIESATNNKYIVIEIPEHVNTLNIKRSVNNGSYYMRCLISNNASSGYVTATNMFSSNDYTVDVNGNKYLLLLVWTNPSLTTVQQEGVIIKYETILNNIRITNDFYESRENFVSGASLTNALGTSLYVEKLTSNNGITWIQGGINNVTGYWESNSRAVCTEPIYLNGDVDVEVYRGYISGTTAVICVYDENGVYRQWIDNTTTAIQYFNGYIRFCHFKSSNTTISDGENSGAYVIRRIKLKNRLETLENNIVKTYSNPVLRPDFPDPTIWNGEDGYFYALATGDVSTRTMYRSTNLIDWENTLDLPYSNNVAQTILSYFGDYTDYWAPCVYKVKEGQWNMYLTKPSGGIAFLTSKYPTYGYEFVKFTTAPFGDYIDPDVARDRDGSLWMFAGSAAMMHRRQMTDDGLDFAEGSEWVHVAGRPSGESGNTNRIKTFEGEYLYRHKGYWYLFCSSGQYGNSTYAIRVVRSVTLDGTFVDKEGNLATDGYAETIMSSNGNLYGPGHNGSIFVDADGKTWMLYHSHWSNASESWHRPMCLDEVLWDEDGWPYFNGGTPSLSHVAPSVIR